MPRTLASLLLLSAPIALAACGKDAPTLSASISPTSIPSGGTTTLSLMLTNFEIVPPVAELRQALTLAHGEVGASEFPNSGHFHVYLDTSEEEEILQGSMNPTPVTVTAAAGEHQLIVRLQGEDHKIIQPEVKVSLALTITP